MKKIAVVGFEGTHKVTENIGYSPSVDRYAKAVMIDGEERIVSSRSRAGPWEINRPVIEITKEYVERQAQKS